MELVAARRPFLYFPLVNHFEQEQHVRYRLERYGAGRPLHFEETTPAQLAEAIATEIGRPTCYLPVEPGGAARAAAMVAELL
jgi:predicted glycosyltransferase